MKATLTALLILIASESFLASDRLPPPVPAAAVTRVLDECSAVAPLREGEVGIAPMSALGFEFEALTY